jgi:DNA-binding NtrC family response regulator
MDMVHFIPPSQRKLAMLASQADSAPVLILGPSGTGKSSIVGWINSNSPRSTRPFIIASDQKPLSKYFSEASSGTLVIHEIGEWPLSDQKLIETFLKSKTIPHPDDESTRMLLNVRIIATSSQGLEGRAQGGLFNAALLGRLNVFRIEMPELSARKDEFQDIVLGILGEITRELHREHIKELSPLVWDKFKSYPWPGNIRELRNVLRVSVITAQGDLIQPTDVPEFGPDRVDFRAKREEFEKIYILELLKTFDFEIDKTCQVSRIDKKTLISKIKKYQIDMPKGITLH